MPNVFICLLGCRFFLKNNKISRFGLKRGGYFTYSLGGNHIESARFLYVSLMCQAGLTRTAKIGEARVARAQRESTQLKHNSAGESVGGHVL